MSAISHRGRSSPGWLSPVWGQPTTGGIASLRYGTGQVVRTAQQIEGTMDLGQVLPGDMEIPGGRIDAPVAEQELNGAQIHPGFQQMRGKAMAQCMDAFAVRDSRT